MKYTEARLKYLEMVQGVINRMGQNSFLIKAWSVTLISALLALSAREGNIKFLYPVYLPLTIFALLDAYYLSRERVYRDLYDRVLNGSSSDFQLSIREPDAGYDSWFRAIVSKTIVLFYVGIALSVYAFIRYFN